MAATSPKVGPLLSKEDEHVQVPYVAGVVCGSEAFVIGGVDPLSDGLVLVIRSLSLWGELWVVLVLVFDENGKVLQVVMIGPVM